MNKCGVEMPAPEKKSCQSQQRKMGNNASGGSSSSRELLLKTEWNYIKGFRPREADGPRNVLSHSTSWINNCCQGRNNNGRILPAGAAAPAFGSGHASGGEEKENKYGGMAGNQLASHRWVFHNLEAVVVPHRRG